MSPTATPKNKAPKRQQILPTPNFTSIDQVNDALRQLCDIDSRVKTIEANYQIQITQIREAVDEDLQEDLGMKKRLERDIEEYCSVHRDEVFPADKKTLILAHGEIGFRAHPPAVIISKKGRWTVEACIAKIRTLWKDADNYLRTKEELNKDTLVVLPEETLAVVGLEIQRKETFGIKLNIEALAGAATTPARVVDTKAA
jgi:phage host-nuclease inhibitor protein Gam